MDKLIYYAETEGISLERMVRMGKFDMRVSHFHNEYEIFLLLEGDRHFFFQNRAYRVKSGSLILVDENVLHMTRAASADEKGHDRIILYVGKDKMKQLESRFPYLNLVKFFKDNYGIYDLTEKQRQSFLTMYHKLCQEFDNRERNYKAMIEMGILEYLIEFMRENHKQTPIEDSFTEGGNSKHRTVYKIADYISEHYQEAINLEGLAEQFYLSKFYLSRTFKEIAGQGINEYVNVLRIRRAKSLLEKSSLTISEISQDVGYESITYFERVFKKYMTLSPLQYRKTLNIVTYTNKRHSS